MRPYLRSWIRSTASRLICQSFSTEPLRALSGRGGLPETTRTVARCSGSFCVVAPAISGRARRRYNGEGYFCAGIGFEAGRFLDERSGDLESLLAEADRATSMKGAEALAQGLQKLGETLFQIHPFRPERDLPSLWRKILSDWIAGAEAGALSSQYGEAALPFVEAAHLSLGLGDIVRAVERGSSIRE